MGSGLLLQPSIRIGYAKAVRISLGFSPPLTRNRRWTEEEEAEEATQRLQKVDEACACMGAQTVLHLYSVWPST